MPDGRNGPLAGFTDWKEVERWELDDFPAAERQERRALRFFRRNEGDLWLTLHKPVEWRYAGAVTEIVWVRSGTPQRNARWQDRFPISTAMIRRAIAFAGEVVA